KPKDGKDELKEAFDEIDHWRELYLNPQSPVIPVPKLASRVQPQPSYYGAQYSAS
ncbi:hypothetical protein PanWU01x14_241610, partial [Parasponia andersonii]